MSEWTETVIDSEFDMMGLDAVFVGKPESPVPVYLFMGVRKSPNAKHPLDFDEGSERKRRDAHSRSGVTASFPKNPDEEIGGTVDDRRVLLEFRCGIHEPGDFDNLLEPVQIPLAGRLDLGKQIDCADSRGIRTCLDLGIGAKLALDENSIANRQLS